MIELTKIKRNKIIEEIKYFSQFDHFYSQKEWNQYFEYLSEPNEIENLLEAFNSFDVLKLTVQYMYTHIDDEGKIVLLDDMIKQNQFVREYAGYFKRVERDFVYILTSNKVPLFFIDVDNTLTDYGVLSEEKINYIKNFKYKDHIILSTGKVSKSIMDCIEACGLQDNYYSCLNGSVICKNGNFELINKLGSISEEFINKLKKTGLVFMAYYENEIKKVVEFDEFSKKMLKQYNEWFVNEDEEIDYNRIVKILCFIKDDGTEEQKRQEKMVQDVIEGLDDYICVRTAYQCYEILRKDQHKGNSVIKIAEKMNLYYRCSIGIGDSMNDYPMLTYTGNSYIVSTSSDELKSHNFEVLKGSRSEDIVLLLKKFENREMV